MVDRTARHPGLLSAEQSLLLVIDVQTRLLSAMADSDAQEVTANTVKLLAAAETLAIPVLLTEQYPQGLGASHADIAHAMPDAARCFAKTAFSCCGAEGLIAALQVSARSQVVLTGQEAHVCVLQTALELLAAGYAVFVVEDGVCSRSARHKDNALARLRQAGVVIVNYESVLFEWLQDARHPQFKTLSALLR
ncbi:MAG: isochorismatase family protein [Methylomonas sp.]|nr:isochorismatase family protein [Methylomonas sp.]PPD21236.1 MAG: hydrolase [Methylomonas sp.]PPD27656.1 MAG: hydrolase [Methylomonas sp.]PPD38212.1 MAG: hydrolase [Methylomonas sp.]PPD39642.1 MAG: hydrolase [Methylomonas sp.]